MSIPHMDRETPLAFQSFMIHPTCINMMSPHPVDTFLELISFSLCGKNSHLIVPHVYNRPLPGTSSLKISQAGDRLDVFLCAGVQCAYFLTSSACTRKSACTFKQIEFHRNCVYFFFACVFRLRLHPTIKSIIST